MVSALAAARAEASSPAGCALWCVPVGASITGRLIRWPSTSVEVSMLLTSTRTRGRSLTASMARTLAVLVVQSCASRSPKIRSNSALGMVSLARDS